MSTSSSFNSLSPSSPLGEFPSKPARHQMPLPSPGAPSLLFPPIPSYSCRQSLQLLSFVNPITQLWGIEIEYNT